MSLYYPETYKNQSLALLDEEFLATLSEQRSREIFAKVTSLDIHENPIDQIEGRVTSGSINIDGSSSIRRTCSLSLVSQEMDINEFYWGIKTKFVLEIGLRNQLTGKFSPGHNSQYPEVVWFPQGCYVITSFNSSFGTNGATVSISGKDKMCLLNGELGGQLYASVDFGKEEEEIASMEKVTDGTFASSADVLSNIYYLKSGAEADEYTPNEDEKMIPNILMSDNSPNPRYIFIYNKKNQGNYYKKNNMYYYLSSDTTISKEYKTYNMYKRIDNPNDLFKIVPNLTPANYTKNKYYFIKDNAVTMKYFMLDSSENKVSGRTYYELKPLYKKVLSSSYKWIPLEKIIREAVHTYAQEPYYNIIIKDLENYGLEQLTYKGDVPLYALYNTGTEQFNNLILGEHNESLMKIIEEIEDFRFYSLNNSVADLGTLIKVNADKEYVLAAESEVGQMNVYAVAKFTYGMDLGYRLTDLTYTGDLITGIGDSLTSMLDKIKTMLSDFEYFYDVNGRFIFQKKQTYVNTSWSQLTSNDEENFMDYTKTGQKFSFNFEGNRLITAISNSPKLTDLRNDYVVWGKRKGISGGDIPIHARYAIDRKPVYYKALDGKTYISDIEYAFEQNDIERESYEQGVVLSSKIKDFYLDDTLYPYMGLAKPLKKFDGTFSSGWWNILDWRRYYFVLTGTYPDQKLNTYFSQTAASTVPINTISNLPYLSNVQKETCKNSNQNIWLIRINKNTKEVVFDDEISQASELYYNNLVSNSSIYNYYFYNPSFSGKSEQEYIQEETSIDKIQYLQDHHIYIVDWREIIYQMADDFFSSQGCSSSNPLYISKDSLNFYFMDDPDHFLYEVGLRNPYYYPTGATGYEQYYTDMEGFWRQLYNPFYVPQPEYTDGYYKETRSGKNTIKTWIAPYIKDYTTAYYVNRDREDIAAQIAELNREIANATIDEDKKTTLEKVLAQYNKYALSEKEILRNNNAENNLRFLYWNTAVFEEPETLNFWFDFLDSDLELAQFSVQQVGDRIKTVNEDKVTSVIYKEIPNFILYEAFTTKQQEIENGETVEVEVCDTSQLRDEITEKSGYTFIYLPKGFSQYLSISYRGMSAKDKIDSLLYQYGYCVESVSITAIPIYYLQPNTIIFVHDKETNINGEYIVDKISLPLNYNGTMSISATKAPERIY